MLIEPPALDSPWSRLPLTIPLALLLCTLGTMGLPILLEKGAHTTPPPPPIVADIIELPPPPAAHPITAPEHAHAIPPMTHQAAHTAPPISQATHAPSPKEPTPNPQPSPAPQPPTTSPPAPPLSPPSTSTTPPSPTTPDATGHGQGQREVRAARALIHPLPVIPDELRTAALNETATARFHISLSGQVQVELIHATQNPRLNRMILESLSQWKFFPAIAEGHPVDSIQDIDIHINVQ